MIEKYQTESPTNNCDREISNSSNCNDRDLSLLFELRIKNANGLIIGNLNINLICNKFDQLKTMIEGKVDILVFIETKLGFIHYY